MLQQILREMWVDPEILSELDEAQKQTLFCKMREEQVRRWQQWDQKVNSDVTDRPKSQKISSVKKQVQFLQGEDGEPWVWVMGEHPEDKSIETMLAEEAKKKAVEQARKEAHQLRKSVEKELTHLIDDYKPLDSLEQKFDLSPKSVDSLEDTLEIYCTVDELRQRIQELEPEVKMPEETSPDSLEDKMEYRNEKNLKMEVNKNTLHFNFIEGKREAYQVWVMGEHPEDKSIETMLAEEAKKKAVEQARKEAHQLRKSVEKELTHLIDDYKPLDSLEQKFDLSPKSVDSLEDTLEIYCTVDELRQRIQELEPEVKMPEETSPDSLEDKMEYRNEKNLKMEVNKNTLHFNFIEGKREAYQELGIPSGAEGVSLRVAAWERRVAAARAGDILRGLRARRARTLRDAQLRAHHDDAHWREQERKAKEAEAAMREIARAAREQHRRSSVMEAPVVEPCLTEAGKPPSVEAVIEWFKSHEAKRAVGLEENNKPADWFHGLITRSESESILSHQPGCFLVRLSSRVWGYAISLRGAAESRCKHFLVESVGGSYRLLGAGQRMHASLADLIEYHKSVPITESGKELLTTPCVPAQTPAILSTPS